MTVWVVEWMPSWDSTHFVEGVFISEETAKKFVSEMAAIRNRHTDDFDISCYRVGE